ncbi:MAG TPA: HD-GYP domain-containing protein [Methylophilaceae bacterium]|jgi:putative nucleotidyltransferase with HDIG domain
MITSALDSSVTTQDFYIDIDQLKVGLFIHLDLGWMNHPFATSNFKVEDLGQIATIKKIGIKRLRYDPSRSDYDPMASNQILKSSQKIVSAEDIINMAKATETVKIIDRSERLKQLHFALDESEKKFITARNIAQECTRDILVNSVQCVERAADLVNEMVESTLSESDIVIHAINGNRSSDNNFLHSLNVSVLSMIMAKALSISEEETRILGVAALFHDIGKAEIPDKVRMKKEPLNPAEQSFLELHCEFGMRMAKKVGLSDRIANIILDHHEFIDGSGYPAGKKGDELGPLSRIVAMVNSYDNLCNPSNPYLAKTPYESLVHMFTQNRNKYDQSLLKRMIKFLGVYPPGSIVQLTNGVHGIVISVNPSAPLRPYVLLHDPTVKREAPQILDLREDPSVSISICMRPTQLPKDALEYLNPRKRVSFYVDQDPITA